MTRREIASLPAHARCPSVSADRVKQYGHVLWQQPSLGRGETTIAAYYANHDERGRLPARQAL